MAKRKLKRKPHKLHIIKTLIITLTLALLLLIPLNTSADINVTSSQPVDPKAMQLDYWPPVISKLETLHAQNPTNAQITADLANAYNNYGVLLAQNKQWTQAENTMQQAIAISTNPAPMKKNLSNMYFSHGYELYQNQTDPAYTKYTHDQVKQLANLAITMDPTNANAYLLLGDVQYMDQEMSDALAAWQQAARLLPNDQEVQKRLAKITRETEAEKDMISIANPYFNIEMDPAVQQNPYFDVNKILMLAHDNVGADFQFIQQTVVPVVVYNSIEYKQTMVDAPGWSDAAYDGKIRISVNPTQRDFRQLTSDVVHEYTHVVVGVLSKNNCPRWFNEGLAKYEEFKHGVAPRIYMLAMAYNQKALLPWDKVNDALLSPNKNEALLAYQQSFSFVYYLVDQYGMYKIVQLLKALGTKLDFPTAVQQVYGRSLTNLQSDWQTWLTPFITNWAESPEDDIRVPTYR